MDIFDSLESHVRSYIRSFPAVFDCAEGALLIDEQGGHYIDFFAGAGTLNYGHNHPSVTRALIGYLQRKGIVHGLDKATVAKRNFLKKFSDTILTPRCLNYKVQFTGPTGTNSVETALKLARKVQKRANVIAFSNAYHGLTKGSVAATGNRFYRNDSYGSITDVVRVPFEGYAGSSFDTIELLRKQLNDPGSGIDIPAAVIVETIQGEGGIYVASSEWLKNLEQLCRELEILLIIDDIQMGNGRTGTFFSFEEAGVVPDMVCLSKSIGGGLPMAILLLRPELDQWQPGEHTGTFRGNNLAFVAATELLSYWETDALTRSVRDKAVIMQKALHELAERIPELDMGIRGRGMVWGLDIPQQGFAAEVARRAFENKLLLETCGSRGNVVKLLPPLIIEENLLREGLQRMSDVVTELWQESRGGQEGRGGVV